MANPSNANDMSTDSQVWPEQVPRVSGALKKGAFVSTVTWGGPELAGTICDREQTGLLLDVGERDDPAGYVFVPWSSIEQVNIGAVTPRRVKALPS